MTLFVNKATVDPANDKHARLTWGAAQAGVAAGVTNAVRKGVVNAQDADELVLAVEDGQAADLLVAHHPRGVFHVLVLEAIDDVRCHHLADVRRVRVPSLGNCAHRDVPVGKHADQPFTIADRDRSHVQ